MGLGKQFEKLSGKWALVTGASSGLGVDFATLLAEQNINLVLAARRQTEMEKLAEKLKIDHGVKVIVMSADLSSEEGRNNLYRDILAQQIDIELLINNAGFGVFGYFHETPWEKTQTMLNLDIIGLTHLTDLFVKDMVKRGSGHILQIASVGGYQPSPTYAAYGAAKAYVLMFGEALNNELKGTGVNVSVLSPGITATSFLDVSGQKPTLYQRLFMMKSRPVAELGIKTLLKGKASAIPGLLNNVMAQSLRIMPRKLQASVTHLLMKN